jgi:OOP family OmpA-OmpF porin
MRFVFPMLIVAAMGSAALGGAAAQSTSRDDIIKALRPSGSVDCMGNPGARGCETRGMRRETGPSVALPITPTSTATPASPAARQMAHPTSTVSTAVPRPASKPADGPSINIQVLFDTDSAELTPAARASLDELGHALSSPDLAKYRFRIEGHTDTVGTPDHNRSLSARRADAVVSYLASTFKLDRAHLQAVGRGSDNPLVQTGPQTPEPRNRRVQIVNIGA